MLSATTSDFGSRRPFSDGDHVRRINGYELCRLSPHQFAPQPSSSSALWVLIHSLNANSGCIADRIVNFHPASARPTIQRVHRSSCKRRDRAPGQGRRSADLYLHRRTGRSQVGVYGSGGEVDGWLRQADRKTLCWTYMETGRRKRDSGSGSGRADCQQAFA